MLGIGYGNVQPHKPINYYIIVELFIIIIICHFKFTSFISYNHNHIIILTNETIPPHFHARPSPY